MSSNFNGAAVSIIEEDPEQPTGGHFLAEGDIEFTVPAGDPGDETTAEFTWPIPIAALELQIDVGAEHVGDRVTVKVAPNTVVGTLTAAAADGDKIFAVSQSVIDNTIIGELADIDGQALGMIVGIDSGALTITTETACSGSITVGKLIKKTRLMGNKVKLQAAPVSKVIGRSKIGGSYIPAGTVFCIIYQNNDGLEKDVAFMLEALY